MKRSLLPGVFSLKGAAENYWLSLLVFSILILVSFLLFEQQIQQLLNHLSTFLPTDPVQRLSLGGQLSIPMLSRLGQSVDVHQIDMPLMEQALLRLTGLGGSDFARGPGCAQ